MRNIINSLICSILLLLTFTSIQVFAYQPLQGQVIEIPPGRSIDTVALTGLSSSISRVGDPVSVSLNNGFYNDGMLIMPPGTVIEGNVTEVTSAGRTGRNGTLGVRFTTAISPNGTRIPVSAIIETKDGSGIVRGGSLKGRIGKDFLRAAEGAAAGAVLGTAMGGITKGRVGRGAAIGTAIGGGIGAVTTFTREGSDAEIKSGHNLELMLLQPVKVPGNFR